MVRMPALGVAVFCAVLLCTAPAAAEPGRGGPTAAEYAAAQIPHCDTPECESAIRQAGMTMALLRATNKLIALSIVPAHQFPAFDNIIMRESAWNHLARNPQSGAYGLGQALPPEKMFTHGLDWTVNPVTQIRWTYDYMNKRYGGPDGAWAFWQANHWY
ncbi:lytic transglycosylase domain-containing protein [Nocardia sp. NPDC050712]|uniref:aggregation-promoting factor C-terminal-like domain-containing protein n=1 Tax=Nocardia sp. NPDC050712 TaxID=3155518 RepID=UPI0033DD0992